MASSYDVLGVGADADFEEVRRAYYRKAQLFHPDRYGGSSDPERRRAEAEMKALTEAWNTLRNSEARRRYDLEHGLIEADGEDEELGDEEPGGEGLGVDAEQSRPSRFRWTGVRLVIALVVIVGAVAAAVVVRSPPPEDHSAR